MQNTAAAHQANANNSKGGLVGNPGYSNSNRRFTTKLNTRSRLQNRTHDYRKIDNTDKGRQGGTRSLSFVPGQRETENRIREAEGEERGRKDRYENPVDKTERQRGIRTRRHVKEGYRGEGP